MQDSLWQAVLGEIELSVSRASFVTWFKNTRLLRNKDEVLVIGVPNVFIKQQLEQKYNQLILEVLAKNGISPEKVEYKIHNFITLPEIKEPEDQPSLNTEPRTQPSFSQSTALTHTYRQGL